MISTFSNLVLVNIAGYCGKTVIALMVNWLRRHTSFRQADRFEPQKQKVLLFCPFSKTFCKLVSSHSVPFCKTPPRVYGGHPSSSLERQKGRRKGNILKVAPTCYLVCGRRQDYADFANPQTVAGRRQDGTGPPPPAHPRIYPLVCRFRFLTISQFQTQSQPQQSSRSHQPPPSRRQLRAYERQPSYCSFCRNNARVARDKAIRLGDTVEFD